MLRTWRLIRSLKPFYRAETIRELQAAYQPFPAPPGTGAESLDAWAGSVLLSPKADEFTRLMLLGGPGSGKTAFLIRLFADWRPSGTLRQIRLVNLAHPAAWQIIQDQPEPGKTVLLVDGLAEALPTDDTFAGLMDRLLEHTQAYARVMIAVQPSMFPRSYRHPHREDLLRYVGERAAQVFRRIDLPSLDAESVRKLYRKVAGEALAARLSPERLQLWGKPGMLRLAVPALLSNPAVRYPVQVFSAWIARTLQPFGIKAPMYRRVLGEMARRMYAARHREGAWRLSAVDAERIFIRYLQEERADLPPLLQREGDHVRFASLSLIAYLLADQSFREGLGSEQTDFQNMPLAARFYLEIAVQQFLEESGPEAAYVRSEAQPALHPLAAAPADTLAGITRLYLSQRHGAELRMLRCMRQLRGVYLDAAPHQAPSPYLLDELPPGEPLIYLRNQTRHWAPYVFARSAPGTISSSGGVISVASKELLPVSLHEPALHQPAPRRQDAAAGHRGLLRLFSLPLASLPDAFSHPLAANGAAEKWERFTGIPECELFNRIEIARLHDGSRNLLLENTFLPTLLTDLLARLVNRIVDIYAEDDRMQGHFGPDDLSQIEDGIWMGRSWLWGNTDSYAYGVRLYMPEPGKIRMKILGLE
jgi:hypothetical protein